jgi:hypothetical protein
MKKFLLILLPVLAMIAPPANAQQVYGPVVKSWSELAAISQSYTEQQYLEIKDGSGLENKASQNPELPIPAGVKIFRTKPAPAGSIGQMGFDAPAPLNTFLGLDDGNVRSISVIPPDTHGAVGESQIVTVTNAEILVQGKTFGETLSPGIVRLNVFFGSVSFGGSAPSCFDPRAFYDPVHRRFIVITAVNGSSSISNNGFIIAISQPGTAQGNWTFYGIDGDAGNTTWYDYPYVGFNKDLLVVTGNMFSAANAFQNSKMWIFKKVDLYDGRPINYSTNTQEIFRPNSDGASFCPAIDYDNTSNRVMMVQNWNGNLNGSGYTRLSYIEGMPPAASFNVLGLVESAGLTWASSGGGNFAPQQGGSQAIDAGDARMGNAVVINGKIWYAHTIFQPATNPTICGISWCSTNLNGEVQMNGTIFGGVYRYYPSIAVNRSEDVLIGYTVSSAGRYASAAYAYRIAADPWGQVRNEYAFQEGLDYYFKAFSGTRNRWGDYSVSTLDPVNQTLWTVQQYAELRQGGTTSRWATQWAQVNSSSALGPLPVTLLTFDASLSRTKEAQLTWSVTAESNAKGYEIQRSRDGAIFEKVGFVAARNQNGALNYAYTDREPLYGKSYYRLRMVDNNGQSKTSATKAIVNEQASFVLLGLGANPVRSNMQVRMYAPGPTKVEIQVTNAAGQTLLRKIYDMQEGYYLDDVDVSTLAAGNYFLMLQSDKGERKTLAFVKQ